MHTDSIERWRHPHVFLGANHLRDERRTWLVIAVVSDQPREPGPITTRQGWPVGRNSRTSRLKCRPVRARPANLIV